MRNLIDLSALLRRSSFFHAVTYFTIDVICDPQLVETKQQV